MRFAASLVGRSASTTPSGLLRRTRPAFRLLRALRNWAFVGAPWPRTPARRYLGRYLRLVQLATVAALAISPIAWAQAADKPAPKVSNVITLEETVIEGRVQKPEAFYILQRSNLNYNALEPKKSFVPKILETVKGKPF